MIQFEEHICQVGQNHPLGELSFLKREASLGKKPVIWSHIRSWDKFFTFFAWSPRPFFLVKPCEPIGIVPLSQHAMVIREGLLNSWGSIRAYKWKVPHSEYQLKSNLPINRSSEVKRPCWIQHGLLMDLEKMAPMLEEVSPGRVPSLTSHLEIPQFQAVWGVQPQTYGAEKIANNLSGSWATVPRMVKNPHLFWMDLFHTLNGCAVII